MIVFYITSKFNKAIATNQKKNDEPNCMSWLVCLSSASAQQILFATARLLDWTLKVRICVSYSICVWNTLAKCSSIQSSMIDVLFIFLLISCCFCCLYYYLWNILLWCWCCRAAVLTLCPLHTGFNGIFHFIADEHWLAIDTQLISKYRIN